MSETRSFRGRLAILSLTLATTACANAITSYRTERFGRDGPAVITQDAKTRNLIMVPERTVPGAPAGSADRSNQWRVCAEAAPDVFSAMSTSAAARLGLNLRNSNAETNLEGAMALAEVAGTIERTAFINMLREAMYRTCERYLSGAIDRASFVVQAGRDWRMMLYGLTIQQLTQTARPPSTILSPPTTSANLAPADRERLIAAQGRLRDATKRYRDAEDLVCPASGSSGASGGGQDDPPEPEEQPDPTAPTPAPQTGQDGQQQGGQSGQQQQPTTPPTGEGGQQQPTPQADPPPTPVPAGCATRTRDMARAEDDQKMARDEIASFGAPVNGTGATTGSGTNNAGNGGETLSNETLATVTPVIEQIVKAVAETDETQLLCLQILSADNQLRGVDTVGSDGRSVRGMCLEYLAARVGTDTQRLANWRVPAARAAELDAQIAIVEAYLLAEEGSTPAARWNQRVPEVQRLYPAANLTVPANATIDEIKQKMRANVGALREFVRIISGGS